MTINGTLLDSSGQPRASVPVVFFAESNPSPDAAAVLTAAPAITVITNASGVLTVSLKAGLYTVEVGTNRRDRFRIQVPSGSGPANLHDIMIGVVPIQSTNYRLSGGYLQIRNPVTGLYHSITMTEEGGYPLPQFGPGEA